MRSPKVGDRVSYKDSGWNGTISFISDKYHYGNSLSVEWDRGGSTAWNFDKELPKVLKYIYEVEGFEV